METAIPILAAIAGGALGWLAKAWEVGRARQDRLSERSEQAAAAMIPLIYSLRARFDPFWGSYDGPPQADLEDDFEELKRISLDIQPPIARRKLNEVADAFYYYHEVTPFGPQTGWLPNQVARKAADEGLAIVGSIRRGENLPDTPNLDRITKRIQDFEVYLASLEKPPKEDQGERP